MVNKMGKTTYITKDGITPLTFGLILLITIPSTLGIGLYFGIKNGYINGYRDGNSEGFNEGFQEGTDNGTETGYSEGFIDGINSTKTDNETKRIFDWEFILNLLNN